MRKTNISIFVDPPTHHFLDNRLFDVSTHNRIGDNLNAPYVALRQHFLELDIPVNTIDHLPEEQSDLKFIYISISNLGNYKRLSKRKDMILSIYVAMECPIVEPSLYTKLRTADGYFNHILAWSDSNSLEQYVGKKIACESFKWPQAYEKVHEEYWGNRNRKLLVMINSNKLPRIYTNELYTERMRAVEYFSRTNDIDLFGHEWDKPSYKLGLGWVPYTFRLIYRNTQHFWHKFFPNPLLTAARKVYKGRAASKAGTISQYKFALCFENMVLNGWITEKIFDCFYSGTVPVYYGAPDIGDYIPKNCYIDKREFDTYNELRGYLSEMSDNDIQTYRENAKSFLNSEKFKPFHKDTFVKTISDIVFSDAGLELP